MQVFFQDNTGKITTRNGVAPIFAQAVSFAGASLPNASDGAALGSATYMWSDLFLASGAIINFNNGDVLITHSSNKLAFSAGTSYTFDAYIGASTNDGAALGVSGTAWSDLFLASGGTIDFAASDVVITHSTNLLTITSGGLTVGASAAGFDVKAFGATAGCDMLYDASEDQLVITQTNGATTGVERTLDVSQTHTGVGASAEALRSAITTAVAGGTYMNALFGKIDFTTSGKLTGLAGVICGEIDMASNTMGANGTYCIFEAEINYPAAQSVPIDVIRIEAWGAQKASFDTSGYLFEIVGCSSTSSGFWYDATNGTTDEWIRVKTPSGDRYLMLSDVQTEA